MSRGKRVYVDEAEWRRVNEAALKLRTLNESLPQLIDDVRRTTRRDFDRGFDAVDRRQRAFESALDATGAQMLKIEQQTNQRLRDHARRIAEQETQLIARIDSTAEQVRQETGELLRAEHEWTRDLLAAEHQERVREASRLRDEIESLRSDKERAARYARDLLAQAEATARHLNGHPTLSRFAAGRVERMEQRLVMARTNLEAGLAEAALPVAQESWLQLSELRVEAEAADLEWRMLHSAATRGLLLVADLVDRNRFRNGVGVDGKENETEVVVDRWSNGGLTLLEGHIAAHQRRLRDELDPLSTDELRELVEQRIPRLRTVLEDITQLAGAEQLSSQLRADITSVAVEVLGASGYSLQGWTYQGSDERGPVSAKVVHADGSEIVIHVRQLPGEEPNCILELTTHNEAIGDDAVRRERAQDVVNSLIEAHIRVQSPQDIGEPEPGREDVEGFSTLRYVPPARKALRIETT
ncbi:hypothetical protein [Streptomyces sp. SD15]